MPNVWGTVDERDPPPSLLPRPDDGGFGLLDGLPRRVAVQIDDDVQRAIPNINRRLAVSAALRQAK
jgi:hypothetical protein